MKAPSLASTCVVIPTHNESLNIARLIDALKALSVDISVVVVDDDSPDGTGPAADSAAARHRRVQVIHRQGNRGRGSAVLEGFQAALAMPEITAVVEMDADFSHDPKELPGMIAALGDCDMLVRSRYLPGSRIKEWGPARHFFSGLANRFARVLLGIPLSDYTNGYRAYTRRAVESLDLGRIDAKGYIVLSEVACQIHARGFRIAELPSVFINRRRGQSNLTCKEIFAAFFGVLRLRARGFHKRR